MTTTRPYNARHTDTPYRPFRWKSYWCFKCTPARAAQRATLHPICAGCHSKTNKQKG